MSDEEVKKALECCLVGECESCPISKFSYCYEILKDEAMSLINRQQAEIERLNSLYVSLGTDSLGNDADVKLKYIYDLETKLEAIKSEAIKEFAERLESKYTKVVSCNAGYVYRTIKEVEKEMVGGENA